MSNPGGHKQNGEDTGIPREWNAFCTFIEAHYRLIYTVALAHVRDAETAQEITQDVCVRLLLEREKLPPMANASGWVARVSRNTAIDWIRRRQTHSRILATMESWNHNPTAGNYTPQDARTAAIMEEEKQRLYTALEHIAPEDREMLLMHYLDGVEKQDIARLLEVHPSTVGRRIDKALRELQKSMTGFEPTQLRSLRPAEHSSRGVLATLGAVAALSAGEKAALAAVAAPLPVLSVGGVGAAAGGTTQGAFAKLACRIRELSSGWGIPIAIGAAAVTVVVAIPATRFYGMDKSPGEGPVVSAVNGTNAALSSLAGSKVQVAKVRKSRQHGSRLVNGLTSIGAGVSGYLPGGATDGKTLQGTVITEDGEPIPGAAVTFWSSDDNGETSITVKSDAKGQYIFRNLEASVPKGHLRSGFVTATADGFAHAARGEYETLLPLPTVEVDLDVVLSKPVKMAGVVVNEVGEAVAGAKVHVTAEYSEKQMPYIEEPGARFFTATSDKSGGFHFPVLKPGYVNLLVEHPEYASTILEKVPSNSSPLKIEVDEGVTIQGTVFDGKSTVTGASISLGADTISPWYVEDKSTVIDLEGRFIFKHISVPDPDRPDWPYVISADIKDKLDLPNYRFPIFRGEGTRSLELNTQDPRAVSNGRGRLVTLTDFPPSAAHGVEVNAAVLHGTVEAPDAVTSSTKFQVTLLGDAKIEATAWVSDGTFRVDGIPAGTYTVHCSTKQGTGSTYEAVYEPVRVELEEGRLGTVHLVPGTATLRGSVTNPDPEKTYHILLRSLDPHSLWIRQRTAMAKLDEDGGFKILGVPAGDYQLSIEEKVSLYTEAISFRPGVNVIRQIRLPDGIPVSGRVLDFSTSESVEGARLQFQTAIDKGAIDRGPITVKSGPDGVYYATLTSGTYHISASAVGQGWMQRMEAQVLDTPTSFPDIFLNSSSGGILAHNRGYDKSITMRELSFDLVSPSVGETPTIAVSSNIRWAVDQDTAMLREVKPGRYGLILRSYEYSETDEAVATVYIPDVEVRPDAFTELDVALERAPWVKLVCYPGRHSVSWNKPKFWIRDSAGVQVPVKLSDSYTLSLGLVPGKYAFGVTLDSGETQAMHFEVPDQDQEISAILQLAE